MKICTHCLSVFSESEVVNEGYIYDDTPYGRFALATDHTLSGCLECGGELVEAKRCKICGEWIPEDSLDICDVCLEDGTNLDNALEYGAEATESVELNGFLAELGKDTIEKVLTLYLRGQEKIMGDRKVLERYVSAVQDEFIDFIIEKETVTVGG